MDGNARHWGLVLDTRDSKLKVDDRRVCFPKANGGTRARQIATALRLKKTRGPNRDRPGAWGEPNLYTDHRNKGGGGNISSVHSRTKAGTQLYACNPSSSAKSGPRRAKPPRAHPGWAISAQGRDLAHFGILRCAGAVAFGLLPAGIRATLLGALEMGKNERGEPGSRDAVCVFAILDPGARRNVFCRSVI